MITSILFVGCFVLKNTSPISMVWVHESSKQIRCWHCYDKSCVYHAHHNSTLIVGMQITFSAWPSLQWSWGWIHDLELVLIATRKDFETNITLSSTPHGAWCYLSNLWKKWMLLSSTHQSFGWKIEVFCSGGVHDHFLFVLPNSSSDSYDMERL